MPMQRQSESALKRAAQKKRAATARAAAAATKAWASEVSAMAKATLWRPRSSWLEESTGAWCAEFVHVSNGAERFVRLLQTTTREQREQALHEQLQTGRAES